MKKSKKCLVYILVTALFSMPSTVCFSAPVDDLLLQLEGEVKKAGVSFSGFSAERGKSFFSNNFSHPDEPLTRSCSTCHTKDLTKIGSHYKTGKEILPLAPSVNSERLGDVKKIKKWFKRNCKWVIQRACSPLEKGDFLTFLKTR